jgi:hypothetical protein
LFQISIISLCISECNVSPLGEIKNAYSDLVTNCDGMKPDERTRPRFEINIKLDLKYFVRFYLVLDEAWC